MVASISYSLFIILLATTVITILPSFNMLPMVQSQDDGGDGGEDDGGDGGEDDGGDGGEDDGGDGGEDDGGDGGEDDGGDGGEDDGGDGGEDDGGDGGEDDGGDGGEDDGGDGGEDDGGDGGEDDGGDGGEDDGEGNIDITSFFGNGDSVDTNEDPVDTNEDPVDTDEDPVALEMKSENMMETGAFAGSLSEMKSGDFAGELGDSHNPKKDETSRESSQSGSAGFASATKEDKVVQESITVPSQQPQFTHITKLIAEDLKKMPVEEIRTYPWNELVDKDVELVIKYLSYEPKFLGKILVNTPEDGISKFQNSLSVKTLNEIIANMPSEQVQLIKDKFS